MKLRIVMICVLLVNLLFLSMPQLISDNFVYCSVGAGNFCPNNVQIMDTKNETELSLATAQYITSLLDAYADDCYYSYNDSCTVASYLTILSTLKNSYDDVIVYSKGHRGIPYITYNPPNTDHRSLLDHYGNDIIDFADIWYRTSNDYVVTFIWHCETALKYPTALDEHGWYGMPYCWTHNKLLQYYGTSGIQVYLGWTNDVPDEPYPEQDGGSPQYTYGIDDNYNYANVAGCFWYYMCNGDTVDEALNTLSNLIYGVNFDQTDLYGWLVVWGNMNMELP